MFAAEPKAVDPLPSSLPAAHSGSLWRQIVEPIEPFLKEVGAYLEEQVQSFDPKIAAFVQYALSNQGKQLRPVLVSLCAETTGRLSAEHVTVAAIIEMVHLATLVHDDVMDKATLRRCRPTLAANWGNHTSVLVGDCLFANALELAASFPTPEICRAVAAAANTVCAGEILQTHRTRQWPFDRAEYFRILEMKTAELFALSCDLGTRLSGGAREQVKAVRQYGFALGTAYQVYDDCVDLFGSEHSAGKSLGSDFANGKVTLPVLVAWERAAPVERLFLQDSSAHWEDGHFHRLLRLLDKYGAFEESRNAIHEFLGAARQALASLPANSARLNLLRLIEFLAQQTDRLGCSN